MRSKFQSGESIIEVVIVAFFLSAMFTALVSLVIVSVARNRLAKEQAVATRLAQQGMEWLRSERDMLGYNVFEGKVYTGNYCINDTALHTESMVLCTESCANCTDIGGFRRWGTFSKPGTSVNVVMHVAWSGREISQTGVLNQWVR